MSSPLNSRCGPNPRRTDRGSAIITVLMLASVTAVIAAGFLFRSSQEAKMATRSLYDSVALNLAEGAIEEGLFAANTGNFTAGNGWALATGSATDYVKSVTTGFNFTQATGAMYIRVDGATGLTPTVTGTGVVTILNQRPMLKQIRVSAIKRKLWANGIVAKGTLTFSGNAAIDSYDSAHGVYNSVTNRSDQATVATSSTALDTVTIGSNASIYGYVATGADDPVVGSGGKIYGATTPAGTNVDTSRIRHDFTANLPDASAPTTAATSLGAMTTTISLPRVGDTPGANGRYLYTASSLSLAGHDAVVILGPVDLIVTGDVSTSGNASLTVGGVGSTNPSLNLYSPGTISLTGNGMVNATDTPSSATIWGTATSASTQSVTIGGNGSYIGTVYAPNANVTFNGNGATSGAVISKTTTISGNGQFHYDIELATLSSTMDTTFRVTAWAELNMAPTSGSAFARDNRTPFNTLF